MQLHPPQDKELAPEQAPEQAPQEAPPRSPARAPEPSPKPKRKLFGKPWAIALLTAVLLGIGTTAYLAKRNAEPKTDIIAELTVPVESQNITVRIQASGNVRPIQSVNLSPKTAGRIAELYVEQGESVELGHVVARMESDDVRAQLLQAQAGLTRAKARLAQLQAGNRYEEISQAKARVDSAKARLAMLLAGSRSEEIVQAQARARRHGRHAPEDAVR